MPRPRTKHPHRPDPRNPLTFDVRDLGAGTARALSRTVPAPAHMGAEMARVPVGADLELAVRLEGVAEGVLVTASVTVPLACECARCLEPFESQEEVWFRELFSAEPGPAAGPDDAADSYWLDGSGQLDLEPALRDAVVLELPLSPLCREDCQGLCPDCGTRLADAGPGHGHERHGVLQAALKDYRAAVPPGQAKEH